MKKSGAYVVQAENFGKDVDKVTDGLNSLSRAYNHCNAIVSSFDKSDYLNNYVENEIAEIMAIIKEVVLELSSQKGLVYSKAVEIDRRIEEELAEARRKREEEEKKKETEKANEKEVSTTTSSSTVSSLPVGKKDIKMVTLDG